MIRTNVIFTEKQHKHLKDRAKSQGKTLGELVRQSVDTVLRMDDPLNRRLTVAIEAYREGFISIGRFAEISGLDPVSARNLLTENNIQQSAGSVEEIKSDILNA